MHVAQRRRTSDAGGYPVYSEGRHGSMHVFAHRCLDAGELRLGAEALARFLPDCPPVDAPSVHLHWHMIVFDVGLGRWLRGYERFMASVLPRVARGEARTDAPSALWQLALASNAPEVLPWEAVARVARAHLAEPRAYVALHDALALTGARDLDALDRWIDRRSVGRSSADALLHRVGLGLRAHLVGEDDEARRLLRSAGPRLGRLGSSRAQRAILLDITRRGAAR